MSQFHKRKQKPAGFIDFRNTSQFSSLRSLKLERMAESRAKIEFQTKKELYEAIAIACYFCKVVPRKGPIYQSNELIPKNEDSNDESIRHNLPSDPGRRKLCVGDFGSKIRKCGIGW